MDSLNLSNEEMERLIEEAKKNIEEMMAGMTPEERIRAEEKAAAMINADADEMDELLSEAKAVMETNVTQSEENKVHFCSNCGERAGSGNFCEYCGSPLK